MGKDTNIIEEKKCNSKHKNSNFPGCYNNENPTTLCIILYQLAHLFIIFF